MASGRLTRALNGSHTHPRELGAPPTYTEHQCRHAERQLRRAELARARQRAPRLVLYAAAAGLAIGVATTDTLGLLLGGAVALGFVVLAFLPGQEQRPPWQQWRGVRQQLLANLRELTADWTVLWDRRFDSAPTPVTIALGPTGIWFLWVPEPEWAAYDPAAILARLTQDIGEALATPSFAVHAYAMYTPAQIAHVTNLMITGVPQAGPDQLREWAQRTRREHGSRADPRSLVSTRPGPALRVRYRQRQSSASTKLKAAAVTDTPVVLSSDILRLIVRLVM